MDCPKCKLGYFVKDGIVEDRNRFVAKNGYRYTLEQQGKSLAVKMIALLMYLEGLGFRSNERIFNVSNFTVMN
jgi:transposase-like protein